MKYTPELTEQLFEALETLEAAVMGSGMFAGLPASAPTPDYMQKSHDALAAFRVARKHYFMPQQCNKWFCGVCDKYITDERHHTTAPLKQ